MVALVSWDDKRVFAILLQRYQCSQDLTKRFSIPKARNVVSSERTKFPIVVAQKKTIEVNQKKVTAVEKRKNFIDLKVVREVFGSVGLYMELKSGFDRNVRTTTLYSEQIRGVPFTKLNWMRRSTAKTELKAVVSPHLWVS